MSINLKVELPRDIQLEKQILSYCLQNQTTIFRVESKHFYLDLHKSIYSAIEDCFFDIGDEIPSKYKFKLEDTYELMEEMGVIHDERFVSDKIIEFHDRRTSILSNIRDLNNLGDTNYPLDKISTSTLSSDDNTLHGKELCEKVSKEYSTMERIKFKYEKLNEKLAFFSKGQVLTIAGRSGTGKTAFGLQFALSLASGQNQDEENPEEKVIFFSAEMSHADLTKRIIDINFYKKYEKASLDMCNDYFFKHKDNPLFIEHNLPKNIFICDKGGLTTNDIKREIFRQRKKHKNINTIVIDYLQLMTGKGGSRYEVISTIARELKEIAKQFNIRVISLSQTSREGEDGFAPVKLHHLRDSGAIEEASDMVLGLSKYIKNKGTLEEQAFPQIIRTDLLKGRFGGVGMALLRMVGVYIRNLLPSERQKLDLYEDIEEKTITNKKPVNRSRLKEIK